MKKKSIPVAHQPPNPTPNQLTRSLLRTITALDIAKDAMDVAKEYLLYELDNDAPILHIEALEHKSGYGFAGDIVGEINSLWLGCRLELQRLQNRAVADKVTDKISQSVAESEEAAKELDARFDREIRLGHLIDEKVVPFEL